MPPFKNNGFRYVNTPIITTIDCEGAGEAFQVTTLINDIERTEKELLDDPPPSEVDVEPAKLVVKEKGEVVGQLKSAKADKEEINASVAELNQAKEYLSNLVRRCNLKPGLPIKEEDGKIDFGKDFFSRKAYLTVSGQLHLEAYACALGDVYTVGPTFRAENSHTSRHLAEFHMVETEIIFADLEVNMNCAEAYVKYMCEWLLEKCADDMEIIADEACINRLKKVASTPFKRISYTDAVDLLVKAVKSGTTFEKSVEWGIDLASEHERYLTEVLFEKPVIVYDYPKEIKAFYMRLNDDLKAVAAMDVLVPKVGELIGGSQREERLDVIEHRMSEIGMPNDPYEWYLDLRRYGTAEHSGFGLGFERMLLFATSIDNIRDVIPFPRWSRRADL